MFNPTEDSQNHKNRKQNGSCQGLGVRRSYFYLPGPQFQFCNMKKVLDMDSVDGCITIFNVLSITELYT